MTVSEKVAYLRGMADMIKFDENNDKDKLLKAIIDTLDEIAESICDLEDAAAELCEQIDAVDEDLSAVEDLIYEDDGCDCGCGGDCDCDCDCGCDDEPYEIECPNCHDLIYLDESDLDDVIECPNCGETLTFEFDGDCDCDCCDGESEE